LNDGEPALDTNANTTVENNNVQTTPEKSKDINIEQVEPIKEES
jgi:hypothetical protein